MKKKPLKERLNPYGMKWRWVFYDWYRIARFYAIGIGRWILIMIAMGLVMKCTSS